MQHNSHDAAMLPAGPAHPDSFEQSFHRAGLSVDQANQQSGTAAFRSEGRAAWARPVTLFLSIASPPAYSGTGAPGRRQSVQVSYQQHAAVTCPVNTVNSSARDA